MKGGCVTNKLASSSWKAVLVSHDDVTARNSISLSFLQQQAECWRPSSDVL